MWQVRRERCQQERGEGASKTPPAWQLAELPHRSTRLPPRAFHLPLHEDHKGWLRSCCLLRAALCLSHSVSLPVPSLLLVFPEKKVQFQRSVNGECPSSSSMPILLGLSTCSSFPCFWKLPRGREEGTAGLEGTSSKPYHPQTPLTGLVQALAGHLMGSQPWFLLMGSHAVSPSSPDSGLQAASVQGALEKHLPCLCGDCMVMGHLANLHRGIMGNTKARLCWEELAEPLL